MYIEKLAASVGAVGVALLVWKAGNLEVLHFLHICTAYAHAVNEAATWSK